MLIFIITQGFVAGLELALQQAARSCGDKDHSFSCICNTSLGKGYLLIIGSNIQLKEYSRQVYCRKTCRNR